MGVPAGDLTCLLLFHRQSRFYFPIQDTFPSVDSFYASTQRDTFCIVLEYYTFQRTVKNKMTDGITFEKKKFVAISTGRNATDSALARQAAHQQYSNKG